MTPDRIPVFIIIFLYGIVIGSFLNVCIYRIPKGESIAAERSHCMCCGYRLKWYDLIPVFSYLCLGGKCRKCNKKISVQYPIVEAVNGIAYLIIFAVNGLNPISVIYCLMTSALLVLSVIDFRTYEIPLGINIFILVLGLVRIMLDMANWREYAAGFLAVSAVLELLLLASRGKAIGGGDVKLMAAAGAVLGWKLILLAFIWACILGTVIHLLRMKISHVRHVLAMGPYLSMGIFLAALWGNSFWNWYLGMILG